MKFYHFLLTAAAVLPPTIATFNAYLLWDVPKGDVKNLTFPMNIANAPHDWGYNFAQQYQFSGQDFDESNRIDLQPCPDASSGKSMIQATFSTFTPGSSTDDKVHCTSEADSSPGVRCSVEFEGTYDHTYNLTVRNTQDTTWIGTVVDTVTKREIHIGSYTLPAGTGNTLKFGSGYVSYWTWPPVPCNNLPYMSVVFGVPTTDAGVATLQDPWEMGTCEHHANFKFTRTLDDGLEISAGFSSKVANVRFQHEGYSDIGNSM